MGNPLEALTVERPGRLEKSILGARKFSDIFQKISEIKKISDFPIFQASEIDFSGVSGASEYIFWIPHPLEPLDFNFLEKLAFAQSRNPYHL